MAREKIRKYVDVEILHQNIEPWFLLNCMHRKIDNLERNIYFQLCGAHTPTIFKH